MDNTANHGTAKKRRIGVSWKMFAILMCFVTLFAILIWVFEIRMLNFFYQSAKFNELKESALEMGELLGNDDLVAQKARDNSEEYYSDIWVYRLNDGTFDPNLPMVYAEGTREPFGTFIESKFTILYQRAVDNGGAYIAMVPMHHFAESYFEFNVIADNSGNPDMFPYVSGNVRKMNAVCISIHGQGEQTYIIVQRSNIEPMGAMINTLENQVLFVGGWLIVFTLVLAFFMGKFITKPIKNLNLAAKSLARGRYNIEFAGHGYREIEELSDSLNVAARELSKNDELQKELIANVSHDLRTPLTLIKGYSEVMRDIPGENTPENVQVIIDEATRLSELVNDMFDLSRISSGTRKPELRRFCLTKLIESTMQRYDKLIHQDGYKIEFSASKQVDVVADSTMILQVIYNLINNAINYSGEDKTITVTQSISEHTVRVSIGDSGEGIAEEDIPLIWDRYYKVDKVHRRATVGTGLGLSIVKGVLELHNASYGVSSTLGEGSTFWFELKMSDDDEFSAKIVEL